MNPEDYVLSFSVRGVNVFITDIHREAYVDLEALYIIDHSLFKQYFTKTAFLRALDLGLKFYQDKNAFAKFQSSLTNHNQVFSEFFDSEIKGKANITVDVLQKFFDFTRYLCREYAKMNFEFTDKAFMLKDQNQIIKTNLDLLADFKDKVRIFMNKVLFGDTSYLNELFGILSKQFSLPKSILENLTQQELLKLYDDRLPNASIVERRQQAFVCSYDKKMPYEEKEARRIITSFNINKQNKSEVTGQVANPGKVIGKVKLISVDYSDIKLLNEEVDKMEQGDILIAQTTAPELILACKKASAIVADMGGLMSHAAIVSRELGIPCIVGTQSATSTFKDGDIVEVDGGTGVVKVV